MFDQLFKDLQDACAAALAIIDKQQQTTLEMKAACDDMIATIENIPETINKIWSES